MTSPAVAGGDGGHQRLTAAMDEGGRWCLTVTMDGSGGLKGRRSMAAAAVVFNGGSSVRRSSMASGMDYDERTRGRRKDMQSNNTAAMPLAVPTQACEPSSAAKRISMLATVGLVNRE